MVAAGSTGISSAARNATLTSLMVCCALLVCWSPNELAYLASIFGYHLDWSGWFYHFTVVLPLHHGFTTSPWFYNFTAVLPLHPGSTTSPCFYHFIMFLPLHGSSGVHQQLYQPFHLRRQVQRVPAGDEISEVEGDRSPAVSSFQHHLRRNACPLGLYRIVPDLTVSNPTREPDSDLRTTFWGSQSNRLTSGENKGVVNSQLL